MTRAVSGPRPGSTQDPDVVPPAVHGLAQRLRTGLEAVREDDPTLVVPEPDPAHSVAETAGILLETFVARVRRSRADDELWLMLTMLMAEMPDTQTLVAARRRIAESDTAEACGHLLATATAMRGAREDLGLNALLLRRSVVVDVDFCATSTHHTGIQRVVRETVPQWNLHHPLTLVAWWGDRPSYRPLADTEAERVLAWHGRPGGDAGVVVDPDCLVVPWRSTLLLPETPSPDRSAALATLGRFSGNRVGMIGYDCIPLVSPELVHPGMPDRFMEYLTVVKHCHAVAGISASATEEFAAFSAMLGAQGLTGPQVGEVALPMAPAVDDHADGVPADVDPEGPLVVCIGSFEPRKNQVSVLVAAELLWREGVRFRLRFIGGGGYRTEFDTVLGRLRRAGRSVEVVVQASDEVLFRSYRDARFTVFASLHEGYGLPVTESLSHGTPVITTGYGSTLEIAEGGGCRTVDPRDPDDLLAAMRSLLLDDAEIERLTAEAEARPPGSWSAYADDTWSLLVQGLERSAAQPDAGLGAAPNATAGTVGVTP